MQKILILIIGIMAATMPIGCASLHSVDQNTKNIVLVHDRVSQLATEVESMSGNLNQMIIEVGSLTTQLEGFAGNEDTGISAEDMALINKEISRLEQRLEQMEAARTEQRTTQVAQNTQIARSVQASPVARQYDRQPVRRQYDKEPIRYRSAPPATWQRRAAPIAPNAPIIYSSSPPPRPMSTEPATLKVLSGTGALRPAQSLADFLTEKGYKVQVVDYSSSRIDVDTVYYEASYRDQAETIARMIGPYTVVKPLGWSSTFDIIVVKGR